MMKVAQMLTTIPDALPADYADELDAACSRRRRRWARRSCAGACRPSSGPTGASASPSSTSSPPPPPRSARCTGPRRLNGEPLACKLQYPEMASAVETDLVAARPSVLAASAHRRRDRHARDRARDPRARARGARLRARGEGARLYGVMLADRPFVRVPRVAADLSTRRLLTLQWLDGEKLTAFESAPQEARDAIAVGLFDAWWRPVPALRRHSRRSASRQLRRRRVGRGRARRSRRQSLRLRLRAHLPAALRRRRGRALPGAESRTTRRDCARPTRCGASRASRRGTFDAMTIWARFICGPILDDRVRTAADGVSPSRIRAQGDRRR